MIRTFTEVPEYSKYRSNARAWHRIKGAWNNKVFGGSVLDTVKPAITGLGGIKERQPSGLKLEKKLPLRKFIEAADVDTRNGAGFYSIKNVKASMNTFLDIEIMITEGLPTTEEKLLLEKWHSISALRSKVLPTPNLEEKLIAPQSQAHLLNGTGQSKIDDAVNKTKSKKESNAKILKDK